MKSNRDEFMSNLSGKVNRCRDLRRGALRQS
jgi:hypothetical protein